MKLGLRFKLLLLLVFFSVPALFLVELGLLSFEYWEATRALNRGAASVQLERIAQALVRPFNAEPKMLSLRLEVERLRLQESNARWLINDGYVLHELSARPIKLSLRHEDGTLWIASSHSQTHALMQGERTWIAETELLTGICQPSTLRVRPAVNHGSSRVDVVDQCPRLQIEISLLPPWRRIGGAFSVEWPVMFSSLLLVGCAASIFVQRLVLQRLDRIAEAAEDWSMARFSTPLTDQNQDEIGVLTARLNLVAKALQQRMAEREQLATMSERERLARELHDSVKQHGFALELQLSVIAAGVKRLVDQGALVPGNTMVALQEAQVLSKQLRQELDSILIELRSDEKVDLMQSVDQRLAEFQRRSGIAAERTGQLHSEPGIATVNALLKILDEALINVWRHAQANRVRVQFGQDGQRQFLSIVDAGIGFTPAPESSGMGLGNMELRARALPGGALQVDSKPNQGTTVNVSWIV